MSVELTFQQQECLEKTYNWYQKALRSQEFKFKDGISQYFIYGGVSGSGKTTCLSWFILYALKQYPEWRFCISALTGKAALRTKEALTQMKLQMGTDYYTVAVPESSTIHRLIYDPVFDKQTGLIKGWVKKGQLFLDLIIVDEGSMVDPLLWADLLSYNIPILVFGDPFQLPPVLSENSKKFISHFNLMDKPDAVMTQIHRQAEGNPIIRVSRMIREKGVIPPYMNGEKADALFQHISRKEESKILDRYFKRALIEDSSIIVHTNKERLAWNQNIRKELGYKSQYFEEHEKVICLKTNYDYGVFNGQIFVTSQCYEENMDVLLLHTEDGRVLPILKQQIDNKESCINDLYKYQNKYKKSLNLFDRAYAITCHKAQGSQSSHVVVFNPTWLQAKGSEYFRWLYTAITRAQHNLTLVT